MEIKKLGLILVFFLMLASISSAAEKIVYIDLEEGYPYYCNPCWVTYSNSTHSLKGRTTLGNYFFSFNGTSTEYAIAVKMQMIGFNISADVVNMTGSSININTGLHRRGNLAYISNGGSYGEFYPTYSNNEGSYSYDLLFNISRALGYDSVNNFNNFSNYDLSDSVASNAFDNYDTVVLAGWGTPSFAISTALENAEDKGIKVIGNSYTVGQSAMVVSGIINSTAESLTSSGGYMYGAITDAFHAYPDGYYVEESMYPDVRNVVGNTNAIRREWYPDSGIESYIDYGFYHWRAAVGSWSKPTHPILNRYNDYYIVSAGQYTGPASVTHSPTLKSLMYLTLLNYDLGVDSKPIAFNIQVSPLLPGNESNLTCSYSYYDADGDPESNSFFRWYVNDTIISWDNQTLTANNTDVDDIIKCAVRVNNSEGIGDWTQSANNVTILSNAGPQALNPYVSPITPDTNQNLVCEYTYYDIEGDPENSSTFRWFINDTELVGITSQTLSGGNTNTDDVVVCEITPKAFSGTKIGAPTNTSNTTIVDVSAPSGGGAGGGIYPPVEDPEDILECTNVCPDGFTNLGYEYGCSCVADTVCTNDCPYNLRLSVEEGCACVADLFCDNYCPPGKFRTNYPDCDCVDQIIQGDDFKITPVYDDIFLGEVPLPCQVFGERCCDYNIINLANNEVEVSFAPDIPTYSKNIKVRMDDEDIDSIELLQGDIKEFKVCVSDLFEGQTFSVDVVAQSGRAVKRINVHSNPPLLYTTYSGIPFWVWILALVVLPILIALWWFYVRKPKKRGAKPVRYAMPSKLANDNAFYLAVFGIIAIVVIAVIVFM